MGWQTKLEVATPQEKDMVFDALLPNALSLMTDLFGNYVVQKFMERGTDEQRAALARQVSRPFCAMTCLCHACDEAKLNGKKSTFREAPQI